MNLKIYNKDEQVFYMSSEGFHVGFVSFVDVKVDDDIKIIYGIKNNLSDKMTTLSLDESRVFSDLEDMIVEKTLKLGINIVERIIFKQEERKGA